MMKFFYCSVFAIIICLQSVKGQVFVGVKGGLNYVNNDTNSEMENTTSDQTFEISVIFNEIFQMEYSMTDKTLLLASRARRK